MSKPLGLGLYLDDEHKTQEDGTYLFSIVHKGRGYPVKVNSVTKKVSSHFIDQLPSYAQRLQIEQEIGWYVAKIMKM